MKKIFLYLILNSLISKSQNVIYDSLNFDSCRVISINKKTFHQCFDRFNRISSQGYVKNGNKIGQWKLYTLGNLLMEGKYKNGMKNGIWKEYYISGKELAVGKYLNDKRVGEWKIYSSPLDLRVFFDKSFIKLTGKRVFN